MAAADDAPEQLTYTSLTQLGRRFLKTSKPREGGEALCEPNLSPGERKGGNRLTRPSGGTDLTGLNVTQKFSQGKLFKNWF